MLGLPLTAAALLALQQGSRQRGLAGISRCGALLIAGLCVGTVLCSGRYAERITRLGTLPAPRQVCHPVHVGVAFRRTRRSITASLTRARDNEPTPISMAAYSGWKVSSPAFTAPRMALTAPVPLRVPPFPSGSSAGELRGRGGARRSAVFAAAGRHRGLSQVSGAAAQVALAMEVEPRLPTERWEGARLGSRLSASRRPALPAAQSDAAHQPQYLLLLRGGGTLLVSTSWKKKGRRCCTAPAYKRSPSTCPVGWPFWTSTGPVPVPRPRPTAGWPAVLQGSICHRAKEPGGGPARPRPGQPADRGVAAIAVGMTEKDSGYRSGLVLKSYTRAGERPAMRHRCRPKRGRFPTRRATVATSKTYARSFCAAWRPCGAA